VTGTYAEAVAGGYTIRDGTGAPYLFEGATFEPTSLLDFSNPAAFAWAKGKLSEAIAQGADGWMADFAEWLPTDCVLASGAENMTQWTFSWKAPASLSTSRMKRSC